MPKVYEPMPESEELSLKLSSGGIGFVDLHAVNANSAHAFRGSLLTVRPDGVRLHANIDPKTATRAGFSPEALDSNGRLKVIGQESVEAEKLVEARYDCATGRGDNMALGGEGDGKLIVTVVDGGNGRWCNLVLSPDNTRDLAARINRHVAYLDKEGL